MILLLAQKKGVTVLIYKNIEIHNIGELVECEGGGVTWLRVPRSVYDAVETEQGKNMLKGCTGVEFRFVMNSPAVTLKLQSLSEKNVLTTLQVYRGGLQGGWECQELNTYVGTEPTDVVINRANNLDTLYSMTECAGINWDPAVVRVILNRGMYRIIDVVGDVVPPSKEQTPARTLLCYGSSITHGSNSYATPSNWTAVLAHNLNTDLINLGQAGSCRMEPEMVDYIAHLGEEGKWDIATLELGINVLGWENEKIYERVTNTIRQIAGRNPDKKVFVISPFYSDDDYKKRGRADNWRNIISEICANLQLANIVYINGNDILGDMSLISADEVHPNIHGVAQIAERLTNIIKKSI